MIGRALALLVVVASSLACYDPHIATRLRCGMNGECPGNQRCVDDVCDGDPLVPDGGPSVDATDAAPPPDANLTGPYDLTVHLVGPAGGQVVRSQGIGGIDCGATCAATYPLGTQVLLRVFPRRGDGLRFVGWRGACSGIDVECRLTMDGTRDVTAEFETLTNNLVFITRMPVTTDLTTAATYDGRCNDAANAAGINGGSDFVAWIADSTSTPRMRLGTARGFVRMDGLPFTDTLDDLLLRGVVYNPIVFDEGGRELNGTTATGTDAAGAALNTCGNWTSSGNLGTGRNTSGPMVWSTYGITTCSTATSVRVYCFQKTLSAPVRLSPRTGKRIFLTRGKFVPGTGVAGADSLCASEAPPCMGTYKALMARNGLPASAGMITAGATYVTMSGQLIATGRELLDGVKLHTGIWQHADGGFFTSGATLAERDVQTGSTSLTATTLQDCGNWTLTSGATAGRGNGNDVVEWWNSGPAVSCNRAMRLYCLEM